MIEHNDNAQLQKEKTQFEQQTLTKETTVEEQQNVISAPVNMNTTMSKDTVTEEQAPINVGKTKEQREEELVNAKKELSSTKPADFATMSFDQLAAWADKAMAVEGGSAEFTAMAESLASLRALKGYADQAKSGAAFGDQILEKYDELKECASKYISSHNSLFKGWSKKGKCRIALAKALEKIDLVRTFQLVPLTWDTGKSTEKLLGNYTDDSYRCEMAYTKIFNRNNLYDKELLKNDKNLSKFNELNGSSRNEGALLFKHSFSEKNEDYSEYNNSMKKAIIQSNAGNDQPIFKLLDQRADELINIHLGPEMLERKWIAQNPGYIAYLRSVGMLANEFLSNDMPLGKRYLENLKENNPEKYKKVTDMDELLATFVSVLTDAAADLLSIKFNSMESAVIDARRGEKLANYEGRGYSNNGIASLNESQEVRITTQKQADEYTGKYETDTIDGVAVAYLPADSKMRWEKFRKTVNQKIKNKI